MTYPFVQARYYDPGRTKPIRLIVVHDMEWPEKPTAAEDCARMFASKNSPKGSAHYNADNNSVVQSVWDKDTAWGAPGVNAEALHIEHAGYARQSRENWLDEYSLPMLQISAKLAAELCHRHSLPPVHLTNAQLARGHAGLVDHNQITQVYPGGDHWDPGPNFPWDVYLSLIVAAYDGTDSVSPKPVKASPFPLSAGYYFGPKDGPRESISGYFSHRNDLRRWQQQMQHRGWSFSPAGADGLYGPTTRHVAADFQREKRPKSGPIDGLIGLATWTAAWELPVT